MREHRCQIRWKGTEEGKPAGRGRESSNPTGDLRLREGKVPYLYYPALEESGLVRHGFSTRLGGVSQGIYSTMNLSFTRGDFAEAVQENYRLMGEALGIPPENMVCSQQTHTTNVRLVTADDKGRGVTGPRGWEDVDGMITDVPGVALVTFYADCVPLYFLDPVHRAIGLSHSGWRGTVEKMGKVTVEKMQEAFGSQPDQLLAAIGPSICQDCYEVSQDVAEQFQTAFPEKIWDRLMYQKENGKYQLNLWEANLQVLLEAGIPRSGILLPGICTCCNPGLLFSHRASQGKRGNLAAFLMLRES